VLEPGRVKTCHRGTAAQSDGAPDPLLATMRFRLSFSIPLAVLALAVVPGSAAASWNQHALFQDDHNLLERGDAARERTLDELKSLGVDMIKAQLSWAAVAPRGRHRPSGFVAADPAQYPGWARFDALVRDAQARGMSVMLALSPPYPGWATARRGDRVGVDRPSPRAFGGFAKAAGSHFPTVNAWTIGNEPNHPGFLFPQATRDRVPFAPHRYRALVREAVAGLRESGHASDTILFGELLPIGKSAYFRKNTIKPLRFIREFFCLDSSWRPFTGRAARLRGCQRYRPITGVTGFAYHPYTRPNGPRGREPSRDDATIRSYRRIARALDIARSKGRIDGPRLPIWNTEFGFQSDPPDRFQTRLSRIPGFMAESELWLSLRNARVASYSQFTMTDTPVRSRGDIFGTWQGGLRFSDGRPKKGVYDGYRLPIFVRLLGPGAVEVWGAARPGGAGAVVQVQERPARGDFTALGAPLTVENERGYFRARFRISNAAQRRYRFVYEGQASRAAEAATR
jgi:hypothetical protein